MKLGCFSGWTDDSVRAMTDVVGMEMDRPEHSSGCSSAANRGRVSIPAQGVRERISLLALLLFLLPLLASPETSQARSIVKPNFVIIVGEDHGYRDFGFMGSEWVRTPNLDSLAAGGTLFPNGQAGSSLKMPGLRTILTGLHPFQWKIRILTLRKQGVIKPTSNEMESFETIPGQLQRAGYRSFASSRSLLEEHRVAGFTRGIQANDEGLAGGIAPVKEFLARHGRDPFYVWFAPVSERRAEDVSAEARVHFEGKGLSQDAIAYYAGIERFDARVGELIAYLDEEKLRENTLIVYVSGNGWDLGPHDELDENGLDGEHGSGTLYETGFRSPIILNWPDEVPTGRVDEVIVSAVDLAPTLLGYASLSPRKYLAGNDLRAYLAGKKPWSREYAIESLDLPRPNPYRSRSRAVQEAKFLEPGYFLRDESWRFIWNKSWGSVELYDIVDDPDQKNNVATLQPLLTIGFRKRIHDWRKSMALKISPGLRKPGGGARTPRPIEVPFNSAGD